MSVSLAEDLAMVLPIPTPPGAPDDAVRFVDLSGYPGFFRDLGRAFPAQMLPVSRGPALASQAHPRPQLRVHEVGCFEASFVPTIRDFDRLDARFRLPAQVWDKLPQFRDFGFAVFKLRRPRGLFEWLRRTRKIHPMAMEFPRRDASALFFPTVHVHDGDVHPEATFDHALYCQPDPHLAALLDWERSDRPLSSYVDADKSAGIIDGSAFGYRKVLRGPGPNRDVMIDEATLRANTVLGDYFLLRVRSVDDRANHPAGAWPNIPPAERDRLKQELTRALTHLTREREDAWQLAPYRGDLPDRWPTFYESFPEAAGAPPGDEPCRIKFFVWNERVEPQEISLSFATVPSRELREAITAALQKTLDDVSGAARPSVGA